ncbi:unnamed protein product [Arabis nemorensis]|uniref:Uncharacterized protein n=1 Tax=Arabis nemorensis TaxID=586526 RepID=A0A565BSH5_9BRAS|nr:unnamed protein product [Arabis nemorensis]
MCHLPIRPCVLGLKNQRFTDHRQRHEINCGGGLIDYNHRLFSKADNFDGNRSIPMMGSSLREDRIREMLEREIEFLPGTDYLKILRSGISGLDSKDKAWAVQLLAVSYLSLASKMEETDVPQSCILSFS